MKIRHPWALWLLAAVGTWLFRLWMGTLRFRYQPLGRNLDPHQLDLEPKVIWAFWHENLLLPAHQYAFLNNGVLISRHADGEIIAEVCRRLGYHLVRGSTGRRGVEAVREILRRGTSGHVGITPDGPRGPRRQVQPGLVYLAARTGLVIVPCGFGYDRPWRLRSWDRFAVPRPFSRARCITAAPIAVPADADRDQLEAFRVQVERELARLSDAAERWAETGQWPEELGPCGEKAQAA